MHITTIRTLIKKGFLSKTELLALNRLASVLKATWPVLKIKIFGSKVAGVADEESDLDVLILLPCAVSDAVRKEIIHAVFDINLTFDTNLSPLILSEDEWDRGRISFLPIHSFIEEEAILL
ncbi:MAG: nucleotidyltransferase domain-containing protein [Deltaproteobacteria bacterium]|nr:nucleotidyltransferase domain-containing protein [Deltaproteobacteria bacterium]